MPTYTLDWFKQQIAYDNVHIDAHGLLRILPPDSDETYSLHFLWNPNPRFSTGGYFGYHNTHTHWIDEFTRDPHPFYAPETGCARAFIDQRVFFIMNAGQTRHFFISALAWTRTPGAGFHECQPSLTPAMLWVFGEPIHPFSPRAARPNPDATRHLITRRRFRHIDQYQVAQHLQSARVTLKVVTVGIAGYKARHRVLQIHPDLNIHPPIELVFDDQTGLFLGTRWGPWEQPVLTSDDEELTWQEALAQVHDLVHGNACLTQYTYSAKPFLVFTDTKQMLERLDHPPSHSPDVTINSTVLWNTPWPAPP